MSFSVTFLGARVRSFQASIGWNLGATSELRVRLVDDPTTGAAFAPQPVGTAVYFTFFGFNFFGLLQRWTENRGSDGNPVYDVTVVDPREILDGAQVITDGYAGTVGSVANLYNAYGYWESVGFGASQANEGGMPWVKIWQAVVNMANTPGGTPYGGPLTFRGATYTLDLSELPGPPPYYRLGGGVAVSLLEAISQVCEDGGVDFFVELRGFTIRIRTVSRAAQPPLGTLSAIANSAWGGTLVRANSGLEVRNEMTSAFLIGGEQTQLFTTASVKQFWGFDPLGVPILGTKRQKEFFEPFNAKTPAGTVLKKVGTLTVEYMNLNASAVADVVGSLRYQCSDLEMRLAQVNEESWRTYMATHRKDDAKRFGVTGVFDAVAAAINVASAVPGAAGAVFGAMRNDHVNDAQAFAKDIARNAVAGDMHARAHRLYEFVKATADEYLGRRFLVSLPFLLSKTDSETLKTTTSWEVSDGGYQAEGSAPLGLSPLNEDLFRLQDGRFRAFAAFTNLKKVDLTKVPAHGAVVDNGALYMEIQVDPQILADPVTQLPCVVATLNGPVSEVAPDNVGDVAVLAAVLQMDPNKAQRVLQQAPVPLKIAPATRVPTALALPLKSNTLTYGPWLAAGAPGKVRVEHDPSLTPWGYGTYGAMNQAANVRVVTAVCQQQVVETGQREVVGAPAYSLGDLLHQDGPNVTNMDVSVGTEGVTTTYRFETFTPHPYKFSRGMADRIRRMGLAQMEVRRNVRQALREALALRQAARDAAKTAKAFHGNQAKALKRETPHDVVHAFSARDATGKLTRVHASMTTFEEAVVLSNAHDNDLFKQTAVMSLGGLLRPFQTTYNLAPLGVRPSGVTFPPPTGVAELASWGAASGAYTAWIALSGAYDWDAASGVIPRLTRTENNGDVPSENTLNPINWQGPTDIEVYTWGSGQAGEYGGLHAYRADGGDKKQSRLLGLRAPLMLVGWGYDTHGRKFPSDDGGNSWRTDTPNRQDLWRAGPLDTLWDPHRGVWTVPGTVKGYIFMPSGGAMGPGTSGEMKVETLSGSGWAMPVWNWFNGSIVATGGPLKVVANYVATDNRWYVIAADCPPPSGGSVVGF
jgi:hypothetical protein